MSYSEAIDRISVAFDSSLTSGPKLFWHRNCYSDFTHKGKIVRLSKSCEQSDNKTKRRRESSEDMLSSDCGYQHNQRNIAFIFLCKELEYAAEKEQVLQLSDVWQRYQDIAAETDTSIPQSFFSRRTSFKEKLMQRAGDLFEFVKPLEQNKFEREPIIIPWIFPQCTC